MQISLQQLRQIFSLDLSPEQIAHALTMTGLEVEGFETVEQVPGGLQGLVVGKVLSCAPHPNADKLRLTQVDIGGEQPLSIVCGAPNAAAGLTVIVATIGAKLYPQEGEPFVIKKSKIRGEESEGMLCALDEIGLGTGHEGIVELPGHLLAGSSVSEYYQVSSDVVFSIGLTPNRIDAASHWGTARDLRAGLSHNASLHALWNWTEKPQWPALRFPELAKVRSLSSSSHFNIHLEDSQACPSYAGVWLTGVQVGPSPSWLKNFLSSMGLKPINNVVDITNYVLHELGQPLHAFDAGLFKSKDIKIGYAAEGTSFITLDGTERKLSSEDLLIKNGETPLCLAGIMGGKLSGVSAQTQTVFLEAAYFHPKTIRKSSQRHGLKTDASFRYERGADPNMPLKALKRAVFLLQQIAGAKVEEGGYVQMGQAVFEPMEIEMTWTQLDRWVGVQISRQTVKEILQDLDIEVLLDQEDHLKVAVPPYRVDVQRPADVIEEILRIYGYDSVPMPEHLGAAFLAEAKPKEAEKIKDKIAELLVSRGFYETISNSLTDPKYAVHFSAIAPEQLVKLANPLSEELSVMRFSLLTSGLETLAYNLNRKQSRLRIFEQGRVYALEGEGSEVGHYKETKMLSLLMTGGIQAQSWIQKTQKTGFFELSEQVGCLLDAFGISTFEQISTTSSEFELGISLKKGKHTLATLGKVSPKVAKAFDIKQEVWYAEIAFDTLVKMSKKEIVYQEISKFPEVSRDLSLVIPKEITFAQIQKVAFATEKQWLQAVNLFDVYEGEKIDQNLKAYSISLLLSRNDQTMTDQDIDRSMEKLMGAFEKDLGAVIRR